jgi:hypothetical protein
MKVLEDVKENIEKSNQILEGLSILIKKLSRIMIAVNIVNILTLIVLVFFIIMK